MEFVLSVCRVCGGLCVRWLVVGVAQSLLHASCVSTFGLYLILHRHVICFLAMTKRKAGVERGGCRQRRQGQAILQEAAAEQQKTQCFLALYLVRFLYLQNARSVS